MQLISNCLIFAFSGGYDFVFCVHDQIYLLDPGL
jgi:hypothetical protein